MGVPDWVRRLCERTLGVTPTEPDTGRVPTDTPKQSGTPYTGGNLVYHELTQRLIHQAQAGTLPQTAREFQKYVSQLQQGLVKTQLEDMRRAPTNPFWGVPSVPQVTPNGGRFAMEEWETSLGLHSGPAQPPPRVNPKAKNVTDYLDWLRTPSHVYMRKGSPQSPLNIADKIRNDKGEDASVQWLQEAWKHHEANRGYEPHDWLSENAMAKITGISET